MLNCDNNVTFSSDAGKGLEAFAGRPDSVTRSTDGGQTWSEPLRRVNISSSSQYGLQPGKVAGVRIDGVRGDGGHDFEKQ
jgi:hypothetical protein